MSSKRCPRCGKSYPSSYRSCPYCSGRSRERRPPDNPIDQIVLLLREHGDRIFLTVTAVFLLIAVFGMVLSRCSKAPSPPPTPDKTAQPPEDEDPEPTAPPLTISNATLALTVGESAALSAAGGPEDGEPVWTSSDETVASFAEGIVTANAAGTATITVSSGLERASCVVTVKEKDPEVEVALNRTDFTLSAKSPSFQMEVKIKGSREKYEGGIIWSIADPSVATVSETGFVERVARGTTTVTATMGTKVLECIVRVK